jgi:hypothetical protein
MRLLAPIFISVVLLLGVGCRSSQPTASARQDWPQTVDAAATRILATMKDADKQRVRATKKEDLIRFHHGWGTGIRNDFGLWAGNKDLMADCHAAHPDDASMVIIEAVWRRLQTQ